MGRDLEALRAGHDAVSPVYAVVNALLFPSGIARLLAPGGRLSWVRLP